MIRTRKAADLHYRLFSQQTVPWGTAFRSTVYKQCLGCAVALLVSLSAISAAVLLAADQTTNEAVDFTRQIRPILSSKCFVCHGPDEQKREADLRLDVAESALDWVIVPGNLDESEFHSRIHSDDSELLMPPTDSKLKLTLAEKELLDRWISQGAAFQMHWSLVPPVRSPLPALSDENRKWARNGIDCFVASRLQQRGFKPAAEATREQLVRRVTLDLTGLPPTIEEVDAFLKDESPQAYQRLVDRLLASRHYGERMALVWLDAARYADSGGYQNDVRRFQWPWRDWVIGAYNQNMPFDQFSIEQLAGDMLSDPTQDQILATAFNRNHRINNEGGIIPEEWRIEYVADRTETTSTVWLGLTIGCARCHEHKYDPIPQQDFYRMFAFFNNVDEKGRVGTTPPTPLMAVYSSGSQQQHDQLKQAVAKAEKDLAQAMKTANKEAEKWLNEEQQRLADTYGDLRIDAPVLHVSMEGMKGKRVANLRTARANLRAVGNLTQARDKPEDLGGVVFRQGQYLTGQNPHVGGEYQSDQPFSWIVRLKTAKNLGNIEGPLLSVTTEPETETGYRIVLEDPSGDVDVDYQVSVRMFRNAKEAGGIDVVTVPAVKRNGQSCVAVSYDGSGRATGVRVYVNGERVETTARSAALEQSFTSNGDLLIGTTSVAVARKETRDGTFQGGRIDDLQLYAVCMSEHQIAALSDASPIDAMLLGGLNGDVEKFLQRYFSTRLFSQSKELADHQKRAEDNLQKFEQNSMVSVSVMREMEQPRDTYMLTRGAYDQPEQSEPLQPATLSALPSMDPELPRNRLGLARWLFQADHPLTARVAVNRYWQMYFGLGLIKTPEDFGSQGEAPSHPELLDWLAVELRESGWDVKAMQKLIVMSATYRQSPQVPQQLFEQDPDNRLLGRGPRFRLYAQALRDQALAASGLLSCRIGGPPVMPYQPEGLWEEVNAKGFKYIVGQNEDLYRRSMYTFWRRTVPPPSMMNFDNSAREVCSVKMTRTNTPLQALNLLNDPQFVEAARNLAQRMMTEGGETVESRIQYGHRLVLARTADPAVLSILTRGYQDYLAGFRDDADSALALVRTGQSQHSNGIDVAELAALTVLANVLLNLDETVTK
jgi:hypothetical protein